SRRGVACVRQQVTREADHLLALRIEDTIMRRKHVDGSWFARRLELSGLVPSRDLFTDRFIIPAFRPLLLKIKISMQGGGAAFSVITFRLEGVRTLSQYQTRESIRAGAGFLVTFLRQRIDCCSPNHIFG